MVLWVKESVHVILELACGPPADWYALPVALFSISGQLTAHGFQEE